VVLVGVASGRAERFPGCPENYPLPDFAETFVSMLVAPVPSRSGSVFVFFGGGVEGAGVTFAVGLQKNEVLGND